MIQKPNLLKVRNYKVNDKISVHVPTVDEIFDFGDQKYYSIVQTLVATPFDLMVELDDIGIDYETITDYQLFILMMESIAVNEDDTSILFGDLNLKGFQEAVNPQNGEKVLWSKDNDIVIDQMIALEICNAIRKIHFWEAPIGRAGNAEAKRYLIERNRKKKKRLAKKPYKSFLESMIISLVNTEEFPYNYETVMELSVYKLNASWRQIQKKKHWEQTMNGVYFGTVDTTKINLEKINWLSPE
mgnify:CR=1 FL=1|jgi:hypothetical protein